MFSQFWPRLIAACIALILCVAVVQAWRSDRRDRAQLAAELVATKRLLIAADARQRDRDAQLAQTLSALDAEKRAIVTPAQIIRELPKSLPLPAPITLQGGQTSSVESPTSSRPQERAPVRSSALNLVGAPTAGSSRPQQAVSASTNTQKPAPHGAVIPSTDLKPLYDFTLDCQACQAKLSAAQNDLADEKSKTSALTKERDDALRVAKGGSAWRRTMRAARWFLLGAAAGAVVIAKAH